MADINQIESALDAGEKLGELKSQGTVHQVEANGLPFLLRPEGYTFEPLDKHGLAPLMVRAAVRLDEPTSFVDYVNRYKNRDSVVFADLVARKFEAVIDYHQAPATEAETGTTGGAAGVKPRWGRHRATLGCDTTDDWQAWEAKSNKAMSQVDFARFIEDHIPNIADPSGTDLLLMATTLEAKKDVTFRQSTRLANGEHQLRFEETITGTAGSQNGQIQIPNEFVLGLEPFQGVGLKRIDARFRYRITEGKLTLWFELVRAEEVLEKAFTDVVAQIRTGLGDTLVLAGAAPVIG